MGREDGERGWGEREGEEERRKTELHSNRLSNAVHDTLMMLTYNENILRHSRFANG